MSRWLRFAVVAVLVVLMGAASTTAAGAFAYDYDFPNNTRVDAHSDALDNAPSRQVKGWKVAAPTHFKAQGPPTTSHSRNIATEAEIPGTIYREGAPSPSNLRVRPGEDALSFRDSLSNPWPLAEGQRPVFRPGEPYFGVETAKLPPGSVVPDGVPPGHVSVMGVDPGVIKDAVIQQPPWPRFPK